MNIVISNYGTYAKYPIKGGISGRSLVMNNIGTSMVKRAVENVDINGKRYKKGPTNPVGFKKELIDYGQMGDIYHHIEFVAGNYFLGVLGSLVNRIFIEIDTRQVRQGREESITELKDDEAGKAVGVAMVKAFDSGNFDWLKSQLSGILCND